MEKWNQETDVEEIEYDPDRGHRFQWRHHLLPTDAPRDAHEEAQHRFLKHGLDDRASHKGTMRRSELITA